MVRASYLRRQAKSPLFSRSVGGKYYARKPASRTDRVRGWAAFLELGVGDRDGAGALGAPGQGPTFPRRFWACYTGRRTLKVTEPGKAVV